MHIFIIRTFFSLETDSSLLAYVLECAVKKNALRIVEDDDGGLALRRLGYSQRRSDDLDADSSGVRDVQEQAFDAAGQTTATKSCS